MRRVAIASLLAFACLLMAAPAHASTATWQPSGEARELPRVSSRTQAGAAASPSPLLQAASDGAAGTGGSPVPFSAQALSWCTYYIVGYEESGTEWMDGVVMNTGDTDMQNVVIWREWDIYGHTMDRTPFPADCWLLRPSEFVPYSIPRDPDVPYGEPGVVTGLSAVAERATVPLPRVDLHVEILDCGPGIPSGRWWECRITNETSITVEGVLVSGYEDQSGAPWVVITGDFLDTLYPESEYPDQLAPGESFVVVLWGGNPSPKTDRGIWGYVHSEALEKDMNLPVYRFYNAKAGVHFYTASEAEKANVINTLSSVYRFEGQSYSINLANPNNILPVYRFYNFRKGVHFYTANAAEKANVINTLSSVYRYEGPCYNVSTTSVNAFPVYRFYNVKAGVHFYTASEAEKANVINTLSSVYRFEGVGYYVGR